MDKPKVSVIIPVYKVEDWIERALHSLFGQTLDRIEYIFVDDASPDASMEILDHVLAKYPHRKKQVKIIHHPENRGVAAARTSGILAATGEYMIHCDPDDYIESSMYEEMYNIAIKENSDLVFCDFEKHWSNKSEIINYQIKSTPHEYLKQRGGIHCWAPLWNILAKSSIIKRYNILPFEEGYLAEDYFCVIKFLYYSKTLSHIKKPFYHYVVRQDSLINITPTKEKFKIHKINIDKISEFLKDKKGFKFIRLYILLLFKFNFHKIFSQDPDEWYNLYKESHKVVLLSDENFKTKLIWAILFSNHYFFSTANRLYKKLKGKSLLE